MEDNNHSGRVSPEIPKVPDVKNPGVKNPDKVEVPKKPTAPKPKMWVIYMDKAKTIAKNTVAGKNQIGQIIFGLIDLIPGSSVFDLISKIIKNAFTVGLKTAVKNQLPKVKWTRLIMQVIQLSFFIYLFAQGHITAEEFLSFVEEMIAAAFSG